MVNAATAILGVAFFLYVGGNGYREDLALLFIAYALLALACTCRWLCGSLSAPPRCFAIGAYTIAISPTSPALVWAAIPIAIAASMAIAPCSVMSRGACPAFICRRADVRHRCARLVHAGGTTGGATGIGGIPGCRCSASRSPPGLIGLGLVIIWLFATRSDGCTSVVGIAMRGQRETLVAAEACGVPTEAVRLARPRSRDHRSWHAVRADEPVRAAGLLRSPSCSSCCSCRSSAVWARPGLGAQH